MPNYGYHLARAEGRIIRALYAASWRALPKVEPTRSFPLEVFAYSGEAALPDQVASIRSFLRHVGRPPLFNIVSDGSYTDASKRLLQALDPCICFREARDWAPKNIPEKMYRYVTEYTMGRQLGLIMTLSARAPVLYVDSDILFFAGAEDLHVYAERRDAAAIYLPDCLFSGDDRVLRGPDEKNDPVNSGFVLLLKEFDWSLVIQRFMELKDEPNYFTNQTLVHLGMHANGAAPFDPHKYVLQLDDQFVFPDRYASPAIAMRHYVNPVRHKFWTSLLV
jgi:hypothetical protein